MQKEMCFSGDITGVTLTYGTSTNVPLTVAPFDNGAILTAPNGMAGEYTLNVQGAGKCTDR